MKQVFHMDKEQNMSNFYRNSFFYLLPNEILFKILGKLYIEEILNFCGALKCDWLLGG